MSKTQALHSKTCIYPISLMISHCDTALIYFNKPCLIKRHLYLRPSYTASNKQRQTRRHSWSNMPLNKAWLNTLDWPCLTVAFVFFGCCPLSKKCTQTIPKLCIDLAQSNVYTPPKASNAVHWNNIPREECCYQTPQATSGMPGRQPWTATKISVHWNSRKLFWEQASIYQQKLFIHIRSRYNHHKKDVLPFSNIVTALDWSSGWFVFDLGILFSKVTCLAILASWRTTGKKRSFRACI